MNDFDRQLKDALRRCDPPANFAQRVLARAAAEQGEERSVRRIRGWRLPMLRWAAVAAMLLLALAGGGYRIHERRVEEAQAFAAKRQVMLALRITSSKLRLVKQRIEVPEEERDKTGNTL